MPWVKERFNNVWTRMGATSCGVVDGTGEQIHRRDEVVVVDADGGQQVQRDAAQHPWPQLVDHRGEQALGVVGVARIEVVSCGPDPAPRLVAAEPDRQVEQFGGRGRCATAPRGVGRGV